jgi:hypothetical protein
MLGICKTPIEMLKTMPRHVATEVGGIVLEEEIKNPNELNKLRVILKCTSATLWGQYQ